MTRRDYLRFIFLSPLGIGSLALSIAAGIGCGIAAGPLPGLAVFSGLALILGVLGLVTGLGPRSAAREQERAAAARVAQKLSSASEAMERLAALRLPQGELASARDLVVLEGGRFLEACVSRERASSGAAAEAAVSAEALRQALELVNAWLAEADESSIERRFGTADAHPLSEAEARTAAALKDKAADLVRGRDLALGQPAAADRIAIEEELK